MEFNLKTDEKSMMDFIIGFALATVICFAVGVIIGAIAGIVVMGLFYLSRDKEFPMMMLIGGVLGAVIGWLLALLFLSATLF